jgi:hypothetical protein
MGDGNPATWVMTQERLDALASLSDVQRRAVFDALIEWHTVARSEGYEPNLFWRGFPAYLLHSAALERRLMAGSPLFVDRPPQPGGYPDYEAMEEVGAALRIRPSDPDLT